MPHVDDGTLHALLDGALPAEDPRRAAAVEAHLRDCAECRARSEAAASLRERSNGVLGLLEPEVAPDFDEVLVRAGRSGPGHRQARQARWTRGIAWAATIVLALGTGYLIRDRLVPEREAAAALESVTAEAVRGEPRTSQGAADAAARAPEQGASGALPLGEQDRGQAPPARERGAPAAVARHRQEVEETSPAGEVARARPARPQPPEPRPGRTASAEADAEPRDPLLADAEPRDLPVADLEPRDPPVALAPAPPPPPGRSPRAAADARLPSPGFPAGEAVELSALIVTGAASAEEAREITPAAADSLLEGPLLVVPGAVVGEVLARSGARGPEVVSVQRLPDGVEVRVTQRPPGTDLEGVRAGGAATRGANFSADAPAAPAAPPAAGERRAERGRVAPLGRPAREAAKVEAAEVGIRSVRVIRSDAELELSGPLPEEALRALGTAAGPYRPPR